MPLAFLGLFMWRNKRFKFASYPLIALTALSEGVMYWTIAMNVSDVPCNSENLLTNSLAIFRTLFLGMNWDDVTGWKYKL